MGLYDLPEYQLELLLGYDGRRHILESGHFLKFEVRRVISSDRVPHGLAYSLTLHTADGLRLVGFDNAHTVPHAGGRYIENPVQAIVTLPGVSDAGELSSYMYVLGGGAD